MYVGKETSEKPSVSVVFEETWIKYSVIAAIDIL